MVTIRSSLGIKEDKTFKRAVHDRERALNKFLQEDIKEKNKFCFKVQEMHFGM